MSEKQNHETAAFQKFFIKALPLKDGSLEEIYRDHAGKIEEDVFHDYNERLIFTVATLDIIFDLMNKAESIEYKFQEERELEEADVSIEDMEPAEIQK